MPRSSKFPQFGRHANHGFVGLIQSLREFLNFFSSRDLLLGAVEGLSSTEDFFVFFFLDFFFLSSLEELSESLEELELEKESDEESDDEDEDEPFSFVFFFFFLEDFFSMIPLALSLSIRPFLPISFSVFFHYFFFSRLVSLPTIFSMKSVDSFDSPPPLATLEPRLAYGLGVVEFPVFLFLVISGLFEHRSTPGSLARTMPPIVGAVWTPPSRNRANWPCALNRRCGPGLSQKRRHPHGECISDRNMRLADLAPP